MHREYVHVHPAALAMAACMGDLVHSTGGVATGTVRQVPSLPYMIRMRLFDFCGYIPDERLKSTKKLVGLSRSRRSQTTTSCVTSLQT